jgi:hypothetical protein
MNEFDTVPTREIINEWVKGSDFLQIRSLHAVTSLFYAEHLNREKDTISYLNIGRLLTTEPSNPETGTDRLVAVWLSDNDTSRMLPDSWRKDDGKMGAVIRAQIALDLGALQAARELYKQQGVGEPKIMQPKIDKLTRLQGSLLPQTKTLEGQPPGALK